MVLHWVQPVHGGCGKGVAVVPYRDSLFNGRACRFGRLFGYMQSGLNSEV